MMRLRRNTPPPSGMRSPSKTGTPMASSMSRSPAPTNVTISQMSKTVPSATPYHDLNQPGVLSAGISMTDQSPPESITPISGLPSLPKFSENTPTANPSSFLTGTRMMPESA